MPPPKYTKPEFHTLGRYLIDVSLRKTDPVFHDSEYLQEACKVEEIISGNMSRFNSRVWATQRGFIACGHCKSQ